jgi:hypothetical protein
MATPHIEPNVAHYVSHPDDKVEAGWFVILLRTRDEFTGPYRQAVRGVTEQPLGDIKTIAGKLA